MFHFIEEAVFGMQRSEKGEKIVIAIKTPQSVIAIKTPLKLTFSLYFIEPLYNILVAECMKRRTI